MNPIYSGDNKRQKKRERIEDKVPCGEDKQKDNKIKK